MELLVNRIRMIVKPFGPGIDCGGEVAMLAAELAEGSLAHDFSGNDCGVGLKVGHSFRELEAGHELGISFVGQRAADCLLSGNLEPVRDR